MRALVPTLLALVGSIGAQAPVLIKDINQLDGSSTPEGYRDSHARIHHFGCIGSTLVFRARFGRRGVELGRASAAPGSAALLKEIRPGPMGSHPDGFTPLGKLLLFGAHDGVTGVEPWVTDGTAGGTRRLGDFHPGREGGGFLHPIAAGGACLFCVQTGPSTYALVRSDGTPGGTATFAKLTRAWDSPVVLGTRVVFSGEGGGTWITDGTPSGTVKLGTMGFNVPVVYNNKVYFWYAKALHVSDGTPAGTIRLGVPAGLTGTPWKDPVVCNNRILFSGAHTPLPHQYVIWQSDGTLAGTTKLSTTIRFQEPCVVGARCYFFSSGLHVTDGTALGTRPVSGSPTYGTGLTALGNRLLFTVDAFSHASGDEPWVSDGTGAGTHILADIQPGRAGSAPGYYTACQGKAVFAAENDRYGAELWITDGTPAGTALHTNIRSAANGETRSATYRNLLDVYGKAYFQTLEDTRSPLWSTDGTPAGTRTVPGAPTWPNLNNSREDYGGPVVSLGNRLFFEASTPATGSEPWVTDGTAAGTRMVADTLPGSASGPFISPRVVGNKVWFMGMGTIYPSTLGPSWTDGGRVVKPDLGLIQYRSYLHAMGDLLLFQASDKVTGSGFYASDGTRQGTRLLNVSPIWFLEPIVFKRLVFFHDRTALYATDGTRAGTRVIKAPLQGFSDPVVVGDKILFNGFETDPRKYCLWQCDGTTAGTREVFGKTIMYAEPTACGDKIYFCGGRPDTSGGGPIYWGSDLCLWESDGTPAGTRVAFDPNPAVTYNPCHSLVALGPHRLFFVILKDWVKSSQGLLVEGLYQGYLLDTATRTPRLLFTGTEPSSGILSGGRILLVHDDGSTGRELYRLDPGASSQPLGRSTGLTRLTASAPLLGGSLDLAFADAEPGASVGLLLFGHPTDAPPPLGDARLYFDPAKGILGSLFLPIAGGKGAVRLPLANDPNFIGAQVTVQGVVGPAGRPPFYVEFTNGALLTFGR